MDARRSRDELAANRNLHAVELDAHFLKLVEKSGLTLDQRGTGRPVRCIARRMSDGWSTPVLIFPSAPQGVTALSSQPLEEGQRLVLERGDRLDKDRFLEGVVKYVRHGQRPGDDIFVSTLNITLGHF